MSDPIAEDDRQFERVLSRLDALMKRSHGEGAGAQTDAESASVDSMVDVPVLTERYTGPELHPLEVAESSPPVLTEMVPPMVTESLPAAEAEEAASVAMESLAPEAGGQREVVLGVDELVAALWPVMQARMALVVQEELQVAQDNILRRMEQEAEQLLRLQLSETSVIPK